MTNDSKHDVSSPSADDAQNEAEISDFHQSVVQENGSNLNLWIEKLKKSTLYVVCAVALGLLGTAATIKNNISDLFPESEIKEFVKQLSSDAPEIRMIALSQLQAFESKNKNELQLGLLTIQEMLARRASIENGNEGITDASKREIGMAMLALSNLLRQVDKYHMPLQRPIFAGLNLSGVDLSGYYFRGTVWQDVNAHDLRLVGADLRDAHIDGAQFMRLDASRADFSGALLQRVCLEGASLVQTNLSKARIIRSDLNVASLRQADLTAATLQESRMAGTDLNGAILTNAELGTVIEWLPEQALQAGRGDAASLPATYRKVNLGICG